jgi:hypothetical protein
MYYKIEQLKNILASHKNCVFSLDHLCSSALEYIQHLEAGIDRCYELAKQVESAQPKWISVEERLPGDPDDVVGEVVEILIEKGGNILCVEAGFYDHQEKHWVVYDGLYTSDVCDGCYGVVRKWKPLPMPPKEEA